MEVVEDLLMLLAPRHEVVNHVTVVAVDAHLVKVQILELLHLEHEAPHLPPGFGGRPLGCAGTGLRLVAGLKELFWLWWW